MALNSTLGFLNPISSSRLRLAGVPYQYGQGIPRAGNAISSIGVWHWE